MIVLVEQLEKWRTGNHTGTMATMASFIDPVVVVPPFFAVLASAWIASTVGQSWRAASICFFAFLPAVAVNAYILAGTAYVAMLFAGVIVLD
jgi:hypothetical protein